MSEICDILHEQAKADGMGLDRDMFIKRHRRLNHKWLLVALWNLKNPIGPDMLAATKPEPAKKEEAL